MDVFYTYTWHQMDSFQNRPIIIKRSDQILQSHVSHEEINFLAHHVTDIRKRNQHILMVKRSTIKCQNVLAHVTLPNIRQLYYQISKHLV